MKAWDLLLSFKLQVFLKLFEALKTLEDHALKSTVTRRKRQSEWHAKNGIIHWIA